MSSEIPKGIGSLPTELLLDICSMVDYRDLLRLTSMNNRLRSASQSQMCKLLANMTKRSQGSSKSIQSEQQEQMLQSGNKYTRDRNLTKILQLNDYNKSHNQTWKSRLEQVGRRIHEGDWMTASILASFHFELLNHSSNSIACIEQHPIISASYFGGPFGEQDFIPYQAQKHIAQEPQHYPGSLGRNVIQSVFSCFDISKVCYTNTTSYAYITNMSESMSVERASKQSIKQSIQVFDQLCQIQEPKQGESGQYTAKILTGRLYTHGKDTLALRSILKSSYFKEWTCYVRCPATLSKATIDNFMTHELERLLSDQPEYQFIDKEITRSVQGEGLKAKLVLVGIPPETVLQWSKAMEDKTNEQHYPNLKEFELVSGESADDCPLCHSKSGTMSEWRDNSK